MTEKERTNLHDLYSLVYGLKEMMFDTLIDPEETDLKHEFALGTFGCAKTILDFLKMKFPEEFDEEGKIEA
jgi:hypothetical protein